MTTTRLALLALLIGNPAFAADDTADTADTGDGADTADSADTGESADTGSTCTDCVGAGDLAGESSGCGWDGRASVLLLGVGFLGRRYSLRSFQSSTRQ